jgi:CIC family chloride channel protein
VWLAGGVDQHNAPGFGLGTEEVKRRQILLKALLVGLTAGFLAALFRRGLTYAEAGREYMVRHLPGMGGLAVAAAIGMAGGAVSLWLVRRLAQETAGSGIPQVK